MIPHYFYKEVIPSIHNLDLLHSIATVAQSDSQQEALECAYNIITQRFRGYRFRTYIQIKKAFKKDPNTLWNQIGFMHCTQQNYLLRLLLVRSGWFTEADISLGHSLVWHISPHQYLIVRIDGKRIAVDPWNHAHGATIGWYATGFGFRELH